MKVSVCVITYNHERYIAQALDGILNQQVSFDYEVVVADDCSTDRTGDILRGYAERHPRLRIIRRPSNVGMMRNFVAALADCHGEYVALCEGDDYWSSPEKLQRQVDLLDATMEASMCAHNVAVIREDQPQVAVEEWQGRRGRVWTLEDLLRYGSAGATCSLMFRSSAFGDVPDWYLTLHGGDWVLQVLCATRGDLVYLPDTMAVFRRHSRGAAYAASQKAAVRSESVVALPSKYSIEACDALDRHLDYRYTYLLKQQKAYWHWIAALQWAEAGDKWAALRSARSIGTHWLMLRHWFSPRQLAAGIVVLLLPRPLVRAMRAVRSNRSYRPVVSADLPHDS